MTTENAAEPAITKAKVRIEPGNPHAGNGGVMPPKERQFGQPGANRSNPGGWKKEDTARYKLEKMLKMTNNELTEIANDTEAPLFERRVATSLLKEKNWATTASIINQVYGMPKTQAPEGTIQKPRPESNVVE